MEPSRPIKDFKWESVDFLGFMDIIYSTMVAHWGEEDTPVFTMTMPNPTDSENIPMPQILYALTDLQPGIVGNNQTREIKPRVREQRREYSEVHGKCVEARYTGQMMDAMMTFTVYGTSNEEVYAWTNMFRHFMQEYKGYFLSKGVRDVYWLNEDPSGHDLNSADYYVGRQLHYLFRYEEIVRTEHSLIDEIDLRVCVAKNKLKLKRRLPSQEVFRCTNKRAKPKKKLKLKRCLSSQEVLRYTIKRAEPKKKNQKRPHKEEL